MPYNECSQKRGSMSIKESLTLSKVNKTIIAIVGIIGSLVTIYAFFFHERKSSLQYELITDTNVLDIRADISKLEILYDKTNLKEKNENLRDLPPEKCATCN